MSDDLILADGEGEHALRRFFFREAVGLQTPAQVVGWWERRRLAYNATVGGAGLVTIAWINFLGLFAPGWNVTGPPLMAVAAYALAANVMYTGGWMSELGLQRVFGRKTAVVGATLFRYGFAFSVGLTLLPVPISTFGFVMTWVSKLFGG